MTVLNDYDKHFSLDAVVTAFHVKNRVATLEISADVVSDFFVLRGDYQKLLRMVETTFKHAQHIAANQYVHERIQNDVHRFFSDENYHNTSADGDDEVGNENNVGNVYFGVILGNDFAYYFRTAVTSVVS